MDNSKIKASLRKIIDKYSNSGSTIGDDALITSAGLDSIQTLLMLFDVEKEFSIQIDISKISNNTTINDLAMLVEETIE